MSEVPEGYVRLERPGTFLETVGPVYLRVREGDTPLIGLRVGKKHLNIRGIVHGGMLATLADSALGIALSGSRKPRIPMVTVNLSTDFVGSAREGDWIEARVAITRIGGRLAFANCFLHVDEAPILRASGVFALMPPVTPAIAEQRFDG